MTDPHTHHLRHALATVAYRAGKTLRGAPPTFGDYRVAPSSRTPREILAHMSDLMDWALAMARGQEVWRNATPGAWDDEIARFHGALQAFDDYLASGEPLGIAWERLVQGPIADALTHTGQLAMLRRLEGVPIKGENYARAGVTVGRVSADQPAPVREF